MPMSARFHQGAQESVSSRFIGDKSLIEISDSRLMSLIDGVKKSIDYKELFLKSKRFPEGSRHLEEVQAIIDGLYERLGVLNAEKDRRSH